VRASQLGELTDGTGVPFGPPVVRSTPAVAGRCVVLEQLPHEVRCAGQLLGTRSERVFCHDAPSIRVVDTQVQLTTSWDVRPARISPFVQVKPGGLNGVAELLRCVVMNVYSAPVCRVARTLAVHDVVRPRGGGDCRPREPRPRPTSGEQVLGRDERA
jgi:hypothetical protein